MPKPTLLIRALEGIIALGLPHPGFTVLDAEGNPKTFPPDDGSGGGGTVPKPAATDAGKVPVAQSDGSYQLGTVQQDLSGYQARSERDQANGYPTLGPDTKLNVNQLPDAILSNMRFQTNWDANANSPNFAATAKKGQYWIVTTPGTTHLNGTPNDDWQSGDWAVCTDANTFAKVDNTDAIRSVAGLKGDVLATDLRAALGIPADETRIATLEAGAPYVYGPPAPLASAVAPAGPLARYAVLKASILRTYTFSLQALSVANALTIDASGLLSTAAGFSGVAGGGTVTVTVRATDDLGATFDFPVTVTKFAAGGTPQRTLVGMRRRTSSGTWTKTEALQTYPGFTEMEFWPCGGGAGGWCGWSASQGAGYGGQPGSVAKARRLLADLPDSVNYTIGAAGGFTAVTGTAFNSNQPGGTTTVAGIVKAPGGRGTLNLNGAPANVNSCINASDPAIAGPTFRLADLSSGFAQMANAPPSYGPGAGGNGSNGTTGQNGQYYAGGNGGTGSFDKDGQSSVGGQASNSSLPTAGASSNTPGVYGGGGAGGTGCQSNSTGANAGWKNGSAGGFPGGGGGGGASVTFPDSSSSPQAGNGGAGAAGCLDEFYYRWVLA